MLKTLVGAALVAVVAGSVAGGEVVWRSSFADKAAYPGIWDMNGTIRFAFGAAYGSASGNVLRVTGTITDPQKRHWMQKDTAWHVTSAPVKLPRFAPKYTVSFKAACATKQQQKKKIIVGDGPYYNAVNWIDAAGEPMASRGVPMYFPADGAWHAVRLTGEVPQGAAAFTVRLGCDFPNLFAGDVFCFTDLQMELEGADAVCGSNLPDRLPPRVILVNPAPTEDAFRPLSLKVEDESEIDWASLTIKVDGTVSTADFARKGNILSLARPKTAWAAGLHIVEIAVADVAGHGYTHRKTFLIGKDPSVPKQCLRDDGVTLVDGKPFFPIGIYAVRKREFNAYNFDRAMADLKAAGFNLVHSYSAPNDPEFLAAVRKYGMKLMTAASGERKDVLEKTRHNPDVLAWYLGDDTSHYYKPWAFLDRDDNMRAIDTTRLTCQADTVSTASPIDIYEDMAAATDVFLPELYPVMNSNDKSNRTCVATVIADITRIHEDNRAKGGTRRHAVWPIVQNFKGWDAWPRYPTADEVYGMSFALLIHGAKGITWYTYGGAVDVKKKSFSFGITAEESAWTAATNVSRRIAFLAPVLLERDGPQPHAPTILAGPKRDAKGGLSVTGLLKKHKDKTYYLTVNSSDAAVRAKLPIKPNGPVTVLFENRTITPTAGGTITDAYKPLDVHIYRW